MSLTGPEQRFAQADHRWSRPWREPSRKLCALPPFPLLLVGVDSYNKTCRSWKMRVYKSKQTDLLRIKNFSVREEQQQQQRHRDFAVHTLFLWKYSHATPILNTLSLNNTALRKYFFGADTPTTTENKKLNTLLKYWIDLHKSTHDWTKLWNLRYIMLSHFFVHKPNSSKAVLLHY